MFKSWHLAEVFVSLQGEGVWQGTQMLFLRTVGCNVGVKKNAEQVNAICTSWDGREFTCDTDYRKHLTLTEDQLDKLIQEFPGTHVCVTGGEPLLHKELLSYIAGSCKISVKMLHIETSGTLPIVFEGYHAADPDIWITVSPKKDCLSDPYDL